jgi:predicted metal-binding membrane protein
LITYLLKREQLLILGSLAVIVTLAWTYTAHMAGHMTMVSPAIITPMALAWTLTDSLTAFLMWTVMMIGMMLPTVAMGADAGWPDETGRAAPPSISYGRFSHGVSPHMDRL